MSTTITLHLQDADGTTHTIPGRIGRTGQTLMQAALDAGIDGIAADCGGCLTCATCHVFVAPEWLVHLPEPSPDEASMLEMTATPAEPGSRLSCQILLEPGLDGLRVRLPATQY